MPRHDALVPVGRAGLRTTQLGLGTAPLGGLFSSVRESEADDVIATAVAAGIRHFDTAPLYGHTRAEIRLGRGLAPFRERPLLLSTKVGITMVEQDGEEQSLYRDAEPLTPVWNFSGAEVRPCLEGSLERLGVDRVDLAFIHEPEDHLDQAVTETFAALAQLRDEGLVRSIGVGTNFAESAHRFIVDTDCDVVLLAGRFSILDQTALDAVLPAALERDVSIIAGGVFNSGVFVAPGPGAMYNYAPASAEVVERTLRIHAVLDRFGVSPAAAGLQFPLRHPAVRSVLTGARSTAEIEQNIADFDVDIPEELWNALEDEHLVRPLRL